MKCVTSIHVSTTPYPVPCGKCYACLANNRAQWIFRLLCEFYANKLALFVTLTYDEKHLPYSTQVGEDTIFFSIDGRYPGKDVNGYVPSVCKRDVQLFIKRLRKSIEPEKCRYFVTAEYGTKTKRPHYHMLLFLQTYEREKYYNAVENAWPFGHVDFGDCEPASIAYCTKYCLKDTQTPIGASKPFRLMSSKPSLGDIGYQQYIEHASDINFHRTSFKNYRAATPRLWRDKFMNAKDEEEKNILQAERMQRLGEVEYKKYELWKKLHPHSTFTDYVEYLRHAKELKEEIIKNHLTKTKL